VRVRYLPPARDEFLAALEFYEREAPGLGAEFDEELSDLERRLVEHPNSGAPFRHGLRRALLSSFPFAVIYRVMHDEILIVAVVHHSRRPEYWKDRLG
jgi:toxin ParE1/3/4